MEIPGETTNAGALQESGMRATRSYIDASFPGGFAMLRYVGQPMACRISDAVSADMDVSFDTFWERGGEFPPFKVDNNSAVKFPRAVLDSAVGTRISHSFCLTEAVVAQLGQLFLRAIDARTKHAFAPHTSLQAVDALVLASVYVKQRMPASSTYALKRLVNFDRERRGQDVCG
eukprot:3878868-Pleurochrysis_carterae.AAC.1